MAEVPQLVWAQADEGSILYDAGADAWHAGIVKDVIVTPTGNVIVATETGGLWSTSENGTATPLIDTDKPDMWCLSQGPLAPDHVYAGGSVLYETDPADAVPLAAWSEVPVLKSDGSAAGTVYDILVIPDLGRIVIATDSGVWWARIPPVTSGGGCLGSLFGIRGKPSRASYTWLEARGTPRGRCCALALGQRPDFGAEPTVIAAAWGAGPGLFGLFTGHWDQSGNLVFTRARSFGGVNPFKMRYTTLASHAELLDTTVYACASDASGNLLALLRSRDSGESWLRLPGRLANPSDDKRTIYDVCHGQGNDEGRPCNTIGASPTVAERIALGWRDGPFISQDGGRSFVWIKNIDYPHLHGDFHCFYWDPGDPSRRRLFIGSDGGLARTDDLGNTYVSRYNQRLFNLQLLGTTGAREWYGSMGVSSTNAGVLASGTQDNGNITCELGAADPSWHFKEGGDGRIASILANGALCHYFGDDDRARLDPWDGSGFTGGDVIPYYMDRVLKSAVFERVEEPNYRDADGRLMYGIGTDESHVYGLFTDANAGNPRWTYLGTVPSGMNHVSAVASRGGQTVFASTFQGRSFIFRPPNLQSTELPVVPLPAPEGDPARTVHRIVVAHDTLAFASYNKVKGGDGSVIRWDGRAWDVVPAGFPNEFIYAMEILAGEPPIVFIATDAKVYGSPDEGKSWRDVSHHLPKRPHCSDLRLGSDEQAIRLYLATFGRSVWVTRVVSLIDAPPH